MIVKLKILILLMVVRRDKTLKFIYLMLLFISCNIPKNEDIFNDLSMLTAIQENKYKWLGHPASLKKEPFEYIYFTIPNIINKNEIKKMNYSQMVNSCYKMDGLNSLYLSIKEMKGVMKLNPDLGKEGITITWNSSRLIHIPNSMLTFSIAFYWHKLESLFCKKASENKKFPFVGFNRLYCYPTGEPGGYEYASCNCVFYFYYEGGEKKFRQAISHLTEDSDLPHCKKE